jgi:bacterioferritin-associated ferredoxin
VLGVKIAQWRQPPEAPRRIPFAKASIAQGFDRDQHHLWDTTGGEKEPMIICQCNGVSDRTIRKAIRNGASNHKDIVRACTAGMDCGSCAPAIDKIIKAERERVTRSGLIFIDLETG